MFLKHPLIILLFFCGTTCFAQQFSYKPLNPSFGGETFNYQWMLSSATAQNQLTAARRTQEEQSELEQFGENINRQILSQLSRILLQQQLGSIGDITEEGTFTYGNLNLEVFETLEGLVINILDTSNGEETQIVVPNN